MPEPEEATAATTPGPSPSVKVMKLRFAGTCGCGTHIAAGTRAGWDRDRRAVICVACMENTCGDTTAGAGPPAQSGTATEPVADVDIGRPGESLQREYARRSAAREARIKARHPKLGGLILALTDEPSSTRAFKTGAAGEQRAAARLQELCGPHVLLLLNRRLGSTRRDGDIDILAIGPTGVYVVDIKHYPNKDVKVRRSGGLLTPVREQLLVGGRVRTHLLASLDRQRTAVGNALAERPASSSASSHRLSATTMGSAWSWPTRWARS